MAVNKPNIISLLNQHTEKKPDKNAIITSSSMISYFELNSLSKLLSQHLYSKGIRYGSKVGIKMHRSIDAIISILSVIRIGGIYVPLDPSYPDHVLSNMELTANLDAVISNRKEYVSSNTQNIQINNNFFEKLRKKNNAFIMSEEIFGDECYLLFTSGSTGTPKGVIGKQTTIMNRINHMLQKYPLLDNDEVFCLRTSLSFVDSVWDIFFPLTNGQTMLIVSNEELKNHKKFINIIKEKKVTRLSIGPTHLKSLIQYKSNLGDHLSDLKVLDITGEQVNGPFVLSLLNCFKKQILLNRYGCTEAPSVSLFDLRKYDRNKHGDYVPIGEPINNTTFFILNENDNEGELCINGKQVADGYINETELTNKKFKKNNEQNTFFTGDIVRRTSDGELICIGRKDNQVKINGNRVQIDEVENVVHFNPAITNCSVVYTDTKLLLFYTSTIQLEPDELRDWMKERLPEYMIPVSIMRLSEFPKLVSGKIDKNSLKDYSISNKVYVSPTNTVEEILCNIVTAVLSIEKVGVTDKFNDIGIDSLSSISILTHIEEEFNVVLPINIMFLVTNIKELSDYLLNHINCSDKSNVIIKKNDWISPMSYHQKLLWRMYKNLKENRHIYNDLWCVRLSGDIDINSLKLTCKNILNEHKIFRTVYNDEEFQIIKDINELDFDNYFIIHNKTEDYSGNNFENYLNDLMQIRRKMEFNLYEGPVIIFDLIKVNNNEIFLIITTHHITEDGWSGRLFNNSFNSYYNGGITSKSELKTEYCDFSSWQNEMLASGKWTEQLYYWKKKLTDTQFKIKQLYTTHFMGFEARSITVKIESKETNILKLLTKKQNSTLFITLLAVWKYSLFKTTGAKDIIIGSPSANRHYQGVRDTIGFFANMLLFRTEVDDSTTINEILISVKQTVFEAFENQDIPFLKIVESLGYAGDYLHHPLVSGVFILPKSERVGEGFNLYNIKASTSDVKPKPIYSKFDYTVSFKEQDGALNMDVMFQSHVSATVIENIIKTYTSTLKELYKLINEGERI